MDKYIRWGIQSKRTKWKQASIYSILIFERKMRIKKKKWKNFISFLFCSPHLLAQIIYRIVSSLCADGWRFFGNFFILFAHKIAYSKFNEIENQQEEERKKIENKKKMEEKEEQPSW